MRSSAASSTKLPARDLLRDGILVEVSNLAAEAGFKFPVAVSCTVWNAYVEVPPGVTGQDETGRLWDILFCVAVRNDNCRPRPVQLKAICGPGDTPEPVITILMPDEE